MTDLMTRGVRRETCCPEPCKRRKPLIILLEKGGQLVRIKEKGRREWLTLTYAQIWRIAVHNKASEIRQAKADAKKAKQEART